MSEKVTIIDVARRAGVSKGTVDRVLHNRGEVAAKSAEKVRKAIEELGFKPNVHASLLASRKDQIVVCLMPEFTEGEYWGNLYNGFMESVNMVAALSIRVDIRLYAQYDSSSFVHVCNEVLESRPAGVIIVPLFPLETMDFVRQLKNNDIPYMYVDHKLQEDDSYLAYIGMPLYKSGLLCAALLTERCRPEEVDKVAVVRIKRDLAGKSDPTSDRRAGFMDYMREHFPGADLRTVQINPHDRGGIDATLNEFFSGFGEVRYIVMLNSRINLISNYLASHPVDGRRVIGFDSIPSNLRMLDRGVVDILIAQHTEVQSRHAVQYLADYLVMKKCPAERDTYMHMDILTRLNQEYY